MICILGSTFLKAELEWHGHRKCGQREGQEEPLLEPRKPSNDGRPWEASRLSRALSPGKKGQTCREQGSKLPNQCWTEFLLPRCVRVLGLITLQSSHYRWRGHPTTPRSGLIASLPWSAGCGPKPRLPVCSQPLDFCCHHGHGHPGRCLSQPGTQNAPGWSRSAARQK